MESRHLIVTREVPMRANIALLCVLVLFPMALEADPIPIVSGSLVIGATDSFATFLLQGSDGTRLEGQWPGWPAQPCSPCTAGSTVTSNALFLYDQVPFVWGDPFATGSATVGGVMYPYPMFFSGALAFSGGSFTLPEFSGPEDRVLTFLQPFTFTGTVSGFDRLLEGPTELFPLFTTSLAGAGTAQLHFLGTSFEGRSIYSYLGTTYDFADPVPEPATILLTASGLSALVAVRRRRRAQQPQP
jgi:hypothetical protein